MKAVDRSMAHVPYSVRAMIEDAFIVLAPSLLVLIGILWIYRKEWSAEWLARVLASFLTFS